MKKCLECNYTPVMLERRNPKSCECLPTIPIVVVENSDGIKNLAACFVHVLSTNTTYYIDERGRAIITWQGDLFIDSYDYTNNPLNLRAQKVYDFVNNREVIYNARGEYRLVTLAGA